VGVGVSVGLGVSVGHGVKVAVGLRVGTGVTVATGVGTGVGVNAEVAPATTIGVCVCVGTEVGVEVSSGTVALGMDVNVTVILTISSDLVTTAVGTRRGFRLRTHARTPTPIRMVKTIKARGMQPHLDRALRGSLSMPSGTDELAFGDSALLSTITSPPVPPPFCRL
jgi:hypothetical protein